MIIGFMAINGKTLNEWEEKQLKVSDMKQYEVIRQILFIRAGDTVDLAKLGKFYTRKAIEEFVKYGFLKEI